MKLGWSEAWRQWSGIQPRTYPRLHLLSYHLSRMTDTFSSVDLSTVLCKENHESGKW